MCSWCKDTLDKTTPIIHINAEHRVHQRCYEQWLTHVGLYIRLLSLLDEAE